MAQQQNPIDIDSVMPFGKYKGQTIEEIPSNYLRWMTDNLDDKPALTAAAKKELRYRDIHGLHFNED